MYALGMAFEDASGDCFTNFMRCMKRTCLSVGCHWDVAKIGLVGVLLEVALCLDALLCRDASVCLESSRVASVSLCCDARHVGDSRRSREGRSAAAAGRGRPVHTRPGCTHRTLVGDVDGRGAALSLAGCTLQHWSIPMAALWRLYHGF